MYRHYSRDINPLKLHAQATIRKPSLKSHPPHAADGDALLLLTLHFDVILELFVSWHPTVLRLSVDGHGGCHPSLVRFMFYHGNMTVAIYRVGCGLPT